MTWSVYLGSVYDNPEGIEIIVEFMCGDVTLYKGCVFDYLTIQWENISLSQHDLDLHFPSSLPISLTSKSSTRKVFRNPLTLFRIIAHSPNNGKVRPLTFLYELITIDTLEKVVSSDKNSNQFEITSPKQNMNGEEDVCADVQLEL